MLETDLFLFGLKVPMVIIEHLQGPSIAGIRFMKVVIRVDASLSIGTGHVMRCLTLALVLKRQGICIGFICRDHLGHLINLIEQQGFTVYRLSTNKADKAGASNSSLFHAEWLGVSQTQDAEQCRPILQSLQPDWLIVDHYAIDRNWQAKLTGCYIRLMVIDDLTDRHHLADLLLNQNYGANPEDYLGLVSAECRLLTGPNYALLRDEFALLRSKSLDRRKTPQLKRLLVTLGGSDPDNVTGAVLNQLTHAPLPTDLHITVVMGASAVHKQEIQALAKHLPWVTEVLVNTNNMAEVMTQSDLAIGAAGATTWERCCLGLPTIQLVIAFNQYRVAEVLAQDKVVKAVKAPEEIAALLASATDWMPTLSQKSAQICDGLGCRRVLQVMSE